MGTIGGVCPLSLKADVFIHRIENFYQPKRQLHLSPKVSYFYSQTNYDLTGEKVAISGVQRYSRLLTDFSGAYALDKYFTLFGRFSWLRNDITTTSGGGGNGFGPGDQTLGIVLRIIQQRDKHRKQRPTLDLQFQMDLPLYANSAANLPYSGDGSSDLTFSFFLGIPVFKFQTGLWKFQAGGGYTSRAIGFSKLLQWNLALNYLSIPQSDFAFGLTAYGMQATQDYAMTYAGVGSLGSFITNSPSPSLIGLRGKIEHSIGSNSSLFVSIDRSLTGKNAPSGPIYILGATSHFDLDQKINSSGFVETSVQNQTPDQSFNQPAPPPSHKVEEIKPEFISYSLEARITRASDRLNLIKIDKGSSDGVEVRQVFDIFNLKKDGSVGESIARAECITVQGDQAVLRVTEYYKEVWIEEGFLAKRPLP